MSLVLAAVAVFGFSHTVPMDLAPPGLPALLILHATLFVAWVLLFIAQPMLITRGSITLHRRVGWAGLALGCAMVILGAAAILFALWHKTLPFFYPPGLFIVRGFVGLGLFAALLAAAIVQRRRPDWHKRLMLCAAIVIVTPGLERALPLPVFGAFWPFVADAVLDLIALAGPAVDLVRTRRIHPAYLCGVGAIVGGQAGVDIVWPTPIADALLRLVGA